MPVLRPLSSSNKLSILGVFQVFHKPIEYLLQPADSVAGLAGAGQGVALPLEQAHARRYAEALHGGEHLDTLVDGAVVVLKRMYEEYRRLRPIRVFQWRLSPHRIVVRPGIAAQLVDVEGDADLAGAVIRHPV